MFSNLYLILSAHLTGTLVTSHIHDNNLILFQRLHVLPSGSELSLITQTLLPHLRSVPSSHIQSASTKKSTISIWHIAVLLVLVCIFGPAAREALRHSFHPQPPLPYTPPPPPIPTLTIPEVSSAVRKKLIQEEIAVNKSCISNALHEATMRLNSTVLQKYTQAGSVAQK